MSIIFIVLIFIFLLVSITASIIKKNIAFMIIFSSLFLIFIASVLVQFFFLSNKQNNIWVLGLDDTKRFSFDIKNYRVNMTGIVNTFDIEQNKDNFFDKLKLKYSVDKIDENLFSIHDGNDIYLIEFINKKGGNYRYKLFGDYFIYRENNVAYKIPFPTYTIVGNKEPCPNVENNFKINCNLVFLKQYYMNMNEITINQNIIKYKQISLRVEDNDVFISFNNEK